jgi:hypothetical protein
MSFVARRRDRPSEPVAGFQVLDSAGSVVNPAVKEHTQALVDDTIKGLLRSIGDAGASPTNATGQTVLNRLSGLQSYLFQLIQESSFAILTTTALAANASFTSSSDDRSNRTHRTVVAHAFADQPGTLYIEQSPDGTNWDIVESTSVPANTGTVLLTTVKSRFVRFRYVNGDTAQTVFRFAKRYLFC